LILCRTGPSVRSLRLPGMNAGDETGRIRLLQLDGVRALAALAVFLVHTSPSVFPGGFLGVDIFFALSGYLITTLLMREYAREGSIWIAGFYGRRMLRLFPALFVMVILVTPMAADRGIGNPVPDAAAALTYTMDFYAPWWKGGIFAHTWSLAIEEQFYLVWPLALFFALRRGFSVLALTAFVTLSFAIATAIASTAWNPHHLYWTPLPHVCEIGAGMVVAAVLERGVFVGVLRSQWTILTGGAVLVGAVFFATPTADYMFRGGYFAFSVASAMVIGNIVAAPEGMIAGALRTRPLVWLGRRSYAFYLWHFPVILLVMTVIHPPGVVAAIAFTVSLLACALSWTLVESRFLRLRRLVEPHGSPVALV
jgi:peptidoglycan/LPS O-acetylase OafA/YrhL